MPTKRKTSSDIAIQKNVEAKGRSVTRSLWKYVQKLPAFIRKRIVRSQFTVDYNLPAELSLKFADTPEEIESSFKIVHEAYVELGYIDPNSHQFRFSKYQALPTTVILVAKWKDEVIGTMSILPDSQLGLPADSTWDLSCYRKDGKRLAEISSLTIKPSFKKRRGSLLLPLCKLMWHACQDVLQVDGIIAAVDERVEPFYTDLLLMKRISKDASGKTHKFVKEMKATCLYLETGLRTKTETKRIYGRLSLNKNIYQFMYERDLNNIILPEKRKSIHGYLVKKNRAIAKIFSRFPDLLNALNGNEKVIVSNLDVGDYFAEVLQTKVGRSLRQQRLSVIKVASVYSPLSNSLLPITIVDMSNGGIKFRGPTEASPYLQIGEKLVLHLNFEGTRLVCDVSLRWVSGDRTHYGCEIDFDRANNWNNFVAGMLHEVLPYAENQIQGNDCVIPLKQAA